MWFLLLLAASLVSVPVVARAESEVPAEKTVYEKLSLEKSFLQEHTDTLIIRAPHAVVVLKQGSEKQFVIKAMAQEWPKGVEMKLFKGRGGKALVVDGTVPHKSTRVDYVVTVPKGITVRVAGGIVEVASQDFEGSIFVDAGRLIFKAQGGLLAHFKASAGEATVDIEAIQKDFSLTCGGGSAKVRYVFDEKPKKEGLRIARTPTVTLRQGAGRALFSFPHVASVFYKSFSSVTSSFLSETKQPDIRCFFYTAPGTQVGLIKE